MSDSTDYERWLNALANALIDWAIKREDSGDVVAPVLSLIVEGEKYRYRLPTYACFRNLWRQFEVQELARMGPMQRKFQEFANGTDDLAPPKLPPSLVPREPVEAALAELEYALVHMKGDDLKIVSEVIRTLQAALGSGFIMTK